MVRVVFPHRAVEIKDPKNGAAFKVNGQRLKPFLEMPVSDNKDVMSLYDPPIYWMSVLYLYICILFEKTNILILCLRY